MYINESRQPQICINQLCIGYGHLVPDLNGRCIFCLCVVESDFKKVPYSDLEWSVQELIAEY